MSVPFRDEPEFETGQMLIDKERCWEPLHLALWMNQRADLFYNHIWGDKDTFRFSWHRFGRGFGMIRYNVQILEVPRGRKGVGVMCQQDPEGNRLFQHRNMAKWDLLGWNPIIPGYILEKESFQYLTELRARWNGRIGWEQPRKQDYTAEEWAERQLVERELRVGFWLFEDRRPQVGCCGPAPEWSAVREPHSWKKDDRLVAGAFSPQAGSGAGASGDKESGVAQAAAHASGDSVVSADGNPSVGDGDGAGQNALATADPVMARRGGLRCREVGFAKDSTLGQGAGKGFYWWDLERAGVDRWQVHISGEDGKTVSLTRQDDGSWLGKFPKMKGQKGKAHVARMFRVEAEYGALRQSKRVGAARPDAGKPITSRRAAPTPLHIANHAYGIGDAITGLYACMGAVKNGREVIYHTRFPQWLARVNQPGLTITSEEPPKGTPDLDEDYAEQLRYAKQKTRWYGQYVQGGGASRSPKKNKTVKLHAGRNVPPPCRPLIDLRPDMRRLEFSKYVILAPFAAWQARDWPQGSWRRLAWLLGEAGYEVVAIGTKREEERLIATFNKSNSYWAVDHSPDWVMDAMLMADAVIGLDSGMVHLAGLLKVPTICIHAHLPPEFLFHCAPTVKSLTPKTKCVFCRWQPDRGFNEGCAEMCSALTTVGPEDVMNTLLEIAAKKLP